MFVLKGDSSVCGGRALIIGYDLCPDFTDYVTLSAESGGVVLTSGSADWRNSSNTKLAYTTPYREKGEFSRNIHHHF